MNARCPRHSATIARGPGAGSIGPAPVFRWPLRPSWRGLGLGQVPDAHQVVQRGPQGEQPPHSPHPTMARLSEESHGLEPSELLFDELPLLLTDGIAGM